MGLVPPLFIPPLPGKITQITKYEHPMAEEWAQLEEQGKIHNPLLNRSLDPALEIVISKSDTSDED